MKTLKTAEYAKGSLKNAEELFKKYEVQTNYLIGSFMCKTDFKLALAEHDQELITEIEKMIELYGEESNKGQALTEVINLIKGEK